MDTHPRRTRLAPRRGTGAPSASPASARSDPPGHTAPSVSIGFTDAHYFRDIGVTSYGFIPRAMRREDSSGIHGHDERADVGSLAMAVTTLIEILEELDRLN